MKAFYLMGFRAAGKSTVGERLAREIGAEFLDLDREWEKRQGRSILSYVDQHGIEAFRDSEAKFLRETDERLKRSEKPVIAALGGGVVDWAPSREILVASPLAKIYLRVPAGELWARIEPYPERRKIGGLNAQADLESLLSKRAPHFEKISTHCVDNRDINEAIFELKQRVSSWL